MMTISSSVIGFSLPFAIDPGRVAGEDRPHETADRLCLFGRAVLIAAVRDGEKVADQTR